MRRFGGQGGGKDCAADDVGGELAHGEIEGEGRPRLGAAGKFIHIGGHRRLHAPEGLGDPQLGEGRVDHGALPAPKGAGGDKERVPHQRFQGTGHEVVFRVDVQGVGEHGAEQGRIVQD